MKRSIILIFALCAVVFQAAAQNPVPLYVVNGEVREEIASIPPDDIEFCEMLPADEQSIAKYGDKAAHGVLIVTLRYDQPAKFNAADSFTEYIASQVKWENDEPVARVILRYTITPEGRTEVSQELESTDSRLKRRILKAVAEAPAWTPAVKDGTAIASEGVLRIQLPLGKRMPQPVELVVR